MEFKTKNSLKEILLLISRDYLLFYLMGVSQEKIAYSAMGRNLLNTGKSFAVLKDRTYIGDGDEEEKSTAVNGLEIADMIIRGDYFKCNVK